MKSPKNTATTPARRGFVRGRLVGAAAIAFAVLFLIENVIFVATGALSYAAPIDEVLAYYAANRDALAIVSGLVALYLPLLLVFVTGLHGLVERRSGTGADWSRLHWTPIDPAPAAATAAPRFVAPYPASLLKLMVPVGVAMAVDRGLSDWPEPLEAMIVVSDNTATNLILDRISADTVNDYLDRIGLPLTRSMRKIRGDGTALKPAEGWSRAGRLPENERFGIGSSTPREMVQLLAMLAGHQQRRPEPIVLVQGVEHRRHLGSFRPGSKGDTDPCRSVHPAAAGRSRCTSASRSRLTAAISTTVVAMVTSISQGGVRDSIIPRIPSTRVASHNDSMDVPLCGVRCTNTPGRAHRPGPVRRLRRSPCRHSSPAPALRRPRRRPVLRRLLHRPALPRWQ